MDWAICLRIVVLPAFGGETIRPRWPVRIGGLRCATRRGGGRAALALADRREEVHDARGDVVWLPLQAQALLREERGEVVEVLARAALLGLLVVHRLGADHRRVLLAL